MSHDTDTRLREPLTAISSVDGRYGRITEALAPYLSEYAFAKYRVLVECEYFIALSETGGIGMRKLTNEEKKLLMTLAADFSLLDAKRIKAIESEINHDTKSVEYFIKEKLETSSLKDVTHWLHFALTSEDVINIAYALMLSDALEQVLVPRITFLTEAFEALARTHAGTLMLSRTHGQSATPTTFGKEMKVFSARLRARLAWLSTATLQAKLNGATGNWNAHVVAYPRIDWMAFSEQFIERFNEQRTHKLVANQVTTQIECHDSYVAIFDTLRRVNSILLDFSQDIWRYISDGWIGQKAKKGEVGSSTMPHKVNPIDFENAEGNLGVANALFEHFARKLPISRLQRDLSDSTVERVFGTACAHSLIAYESLLKGLGKITVNEEAMQGALSAHPEVLAEAIQTVLRREGEKEAYEKLKELTRGASVTLADIHTFIDGLSVSDAVKKELKALTPENYIGLAEKIAQGQS